ncbi:MAG: hypothetical protein L6V93_22185 [Clostridiales bacterium]|nr:MAG: hypothetical protein L6V93_22185 [Clostridiales bacterium]
MKNIDNVCEIRIGKNMPLSLSLVRGAVFVSEKRQIFKFAVRCVYCGRA